MDTAANDRQIIEAVREGQRPDISSIDVMASVKDVIVRCWTQNPDNRPTFDGKLRALIFVFTPELLQPSM